MNGRTRVCQFVTSLEVGGTERHVATLTTRLDGDRFEPILACLRKTGRLLADVEARGIPVLSYGIHRLFGLNTLRQQWRFARDLASRKVQIVHAYGFYSIVFAIPAARAAGVPIVIASIRDNGDLWTRMQRRVQRYVCLLADHILVNADAVRDQLVREGYRADRITVIRNGVDLAPFAAGEGGAPQGEPAPRGRPKAPLVVLVSRLNRLKGAEHFIDMAALLARRFAAVRFLLVGEGPKRPALEERARRHGLGTRLAFAGLRMDVPQILAGASVSVHPSLSEGLSNVLLEAMAAGVPVVATRVGGTPEVVEDGVTGLLVPPGDPEALAAAAGRLLDDPGLARTMGRAARERAEARWSIEGMVGRTEEIYLGLLEKPRRGRLAVAGALRGGDRCSGS